MVYNKNVFHKASLLFCLFFAFVSYSTQPETQAEATPQQVTQPTRKEGPKKPKPVHENWIFVHGTFAAKVNWHKKDSAERKTLSNALKQKPKHFSHTIHSFVWSGHNNHPARLKAAQALTELLKKLNPPYHIIAHSHGGTVVLLAAQKLFEAKDPLTITELYCLGTPIHHDWYKNAHNNIKTIYNLFSYGDVVQRVLTLFQRTFPETPSVHNIQVKINAMSPRHTELHAPEVIAHLPALQKHFTEKKVDYCIHIKLENEVPTLHLEVDATRTKDLLVDGYFTNTLINLYADSRRKKSPYIVRTVKL